MRCKPHRSTYEKIRLAVGFLRALQLNIFEQLSLEFLNSFNVLILLNPRIFLADGQNAAGRFPPDHQKIKLSARNPAGTPVREK